MSPVPFIFLGICVACCIGYIVVLIIKKRKK